MKVRLTAAPFVREVATVVMSVANPRCRDAVATEPTIELVFTAC